DVESLPPLTVLPSVAGWQRLRLDLLIEQLQYRRRYHQRTLALARMVGARSAEAVVATHVENAIGFARLLKGIMPVNVATDRYIREFSLPASVAGEELTAQYDDPPPPIDPDELMPQTPARLDSPSNSAAAFPEPAARGF